MTPDWQSRIVQIARAFRIAWAEGERPRIESMLEQVPEEQRETLFAPLLECEILLRKQTDEQVSIGELLARFPEYPETVLTVYRESIGGKSEASSVPDVTLESSDKLVFHPMEDDPFSSGVRSDSGATATFDFAGFPELPGLEILSPLGEGGLAVVYKAKRIDSDEFVAVKLLKPSKSVDAKTRQLFLREASALSKLHNKRIVEFNEIGIQGDEIYLVMQYVDIIPPNEWLSQRDTPEGVKFICGVICQTLQALAYIHKHQIVHRDVKPSNILVGMENGRRRTRLSDFGLAKSYEGSGLVDLTNSREIRGTLTYIAPEQVEDCRHVGPSADLYSTGATLYHFLAGRQPLEIETLNGALSRILEELPKPLSSFRPDLPQELVAVVEKALEKKPEDRFGSAAEMYEALYPFAKSTELLESVGNSPC